MNEEDNESFSYIPFQLYNIPKTKEEHRNLKPIFSENYLNTDISLIGNVDDTNHKKYRKKNYFKNQKLNQSADDVRNLINNNYCEVKNNLTEVNVNINENEISIENNFLNKERNKNEK